MIIIDILEAVKTRRSIRGFKAEPVPKEIIHDILLQSLRAPSGVNKQPWEFAVITGSVLKEISEDNLKRLASDKSMNNEKKLVDVYRKRQVELAINLFQLMTIERDDREKRNAWLKRGFRFFDAPVVIIIFTDAAVISKMTYFELGCISQTICLVALKYCMGTCIGMQGVTFPEVIKKHIALPDSKVIVTSISMGYPDWGFPANKLVTEREDINSLTTWHGF